MLVEARGVQDAHPRDRAVEVAKGLADAMSLRAAQVRIDELGFDPVNRRLKIEPFNTRCRFALRFGDLKGDKDTTLARAEVVREAFNSPFRPFVLASTSIGQEGLDLSPGGACPDRRERALGECNPGGGAALTRASRCG